MVFGGNDLPAGEGQQPRLRSRGKAQKRGVRDGTAAEEDGGSDLHHWFRGAPAVRGVRKPERPSILDVVRG
jgi:hypothetical protein